MQVTINIDPDEDDTIIDEFQDLTDEERSERIMHWARLGRFVMSLAKVTPSREAMRDYFTDLTYEMDSLRDTIIDHQSLFSNLSVGEKGSLGEAYVRTSLATSFKKAGDTFEIWSSTGHRGDIIGKISRKDKPPFKVLIEVKDYPKSSSVPSLEIEKFRRDMKSNPDMDAGLFISINNSRISTVNANPFHIEMFDNRPLIFIAQDSANQNMFLISWGLLAELLGRDQFEIGVDIKKLTEQSAARLRDAIHQFNIDVSNDISRLEIIESAANSVISKATLIEDEARKLHLEITIRATGLRKLIEREAQALEASLSPDPLQIFCTESEWKQNWEERGASFVSGKHEANLSLLLRWLNTSQDLEPLWKENHLEVCRGDKILIHVRLTAGSTLIIYPQEIVDEYSLKEREHELQLREVKKEWRIDCRNKVSPTIDYSLISQFLGD